MRTTTILTLTFILTSLLVVGQAKSKVSHMTPIDILTVDHVEMYKYTKPVVDSTMGADHRQLNSEQVKSFVDEWNKATYVGTCKFKSVYRIDLYLKDGTKRTFEINGSVKEIRSYCYEPSDKKYFKDLWDKAKSN